MEGRRIPFTAVVTILVLLAFSDEFLAAIVDAIGPEYEDYRWLLPIIDAAILAVIAAQAWRLPRRAVRRDVLWWSTGAAVMLAADKLVDVDPLVGLAWFGVVSSLVYVAALAILFAATLGIDPLLFIVPCRRTREASTEEEWPLLRAVVPLLVGLLGAYLASRWWIDFLDADGRADQEFFAQMSQVIALLIVALGIENRFYRDAIADPLHRPLAVMSLTVLAVGEVMALSALVKKETVDLFWWHAYLAFFLSVYACLVGLATLILVLVIRLAPEPEPEPVPVPPPAPPPPAPARPDRTLLAALALVAAGAVAALLGRRRS